MSKIKGWKVNDHTGNIDAWVTTTSPFANIWIVNIFKNYANDGLYEVKNDFSVPTSITVKTKKEALLNAYRTMRQYNKYMGR